MKIRVGSAFGVVCIIALLCIGLPVISFKSFALIERQELENDLKQSLNILNAEIQQLSTTAGDYSGWDETYRFVQDENEQYITTSLGESIYTKLRLNVFMVFNNDGRMVFGRGHDYHRKIREPIPGNLLRHLSPGSYLLRHNATDHSLAGLITIPEGTILIVSLPILTGEYQGPIKGTLVMGRFLDGPELKRIGSLVQHNLSFISSVAPAGYDYAKMRSRLKSKDSVQIDIEDSNSITGYALVPDIFGKDAGILMVNKSRKLISQAKLATWLFIIICGSSLSLFVIYFLLARKRLHTVRHIEKLSSERLQAIIDLAVDGIFILDGKGSILSVNSRACEITGLGKAEMEHMQLDSLFKENDEYHSFHLSLPTGEDTVALESSLTRKDGSTVFVEMRIKQMPDASLQCFMRDISERKALEQGLIEQRDIISSMAAELSIAEERERCRIAGELHDQVAPTLLLGKMKLNSMIAANGPCECEPTTVEVEALIDRAVQDIRSLTFQMRPPILANAGLEAALKWLGEEFEGNYGLETAISSDASPIPLTYETRSTIFQIVRELLLNIAKHSGTKQAGIYISRQDDMIVVTVSDQGKGFDIAKSTLLKPKSGGFGIFNSQKKIEFLGGRLAIVSAPGAGTSVTISAPIDLKPNEEK
ncbi:oxygen sensor histidine kinase NreB [Geobacter sp. OR-1]|uniref:sensor histidine kinase n=1 Tax=Geobacter sp. OR-1 TaxID=1266765 RepID=UPI00054287C3|nr:CHASE4 domain-containing protein [Geobacter sp. OR-1]GAM11747.1 oxygen sensor histidine kinase NreB [Geobacter sp. OR-1]